MTGPEDEQTDIIPAMRPEPDDTAVDMFGPVGRARHRRPTRRRARPAAGMVAILAGAGCVGYATYTLGSHAPTGPVPAPPVVSEEPVAVEPPPHVWSPTVRPSRTRADRHRSRTPSPSPSPTSATPAPRQTPTPATTSRPPVTPTPSRTVSPSEDPSTSPGPTETPTSPPGSPEVNPT